MLAISLKEIFSKYNPSHFIRKIVFFHFLGEFGYFEATLCSALRAAKNIQNRQKME